MKPEYITDTDWKLLKEKYRDNIEEVLDKLEEHYPVQYLIGNVEFLNTIKSRSEVDFSGTVNTNDKILTLSTCKDNFGNRVVMHAKLIKKEAR